MKQNLLFCLSVLLFPFNVAAQFSAGANGLYISAGTDVSIGGLTFRPSQSLSIANNTLNVSPLALPGNPPSIYRLYTLSAPITFVGRLGLFYFPGELNGNAETMLQVTYQHATPVITAGSVVNTNLHYIYNDLTMPVMFTAVTAAQPGALPVTLMDFVAKKEGAIASLTWSTTYESNSDYFDVQHSINARDWNTISQIRAAVQSSVLKKYDFTHNSPSPGANYYRLKMVDKDQSFAFSRVRELSFDQGNMLSLYPNPAVEKIRIQMDRWEHVAGVKLLNAQGTALLTFDKKPVSNEIDVKDFPAGIYLVQLHFNDGSTAAVKVIKQ